jgi:antitoxin (DNA-binding transcriptional repressor) of toxin-antitoxin stability system
MSKPRVKHGIPAEPLDLTASPEEFVARLAEIAAKKQRVVVRRRGRAVAALVPLRDLRLLEQIWEQLEDESDVEYARKMLADPTQTPVPLSEVRAKLGL